MPVEEKRSRMRLLRDIVRTHNVQVWAESFLNAALTVHPSAKSPEQSRRDSHGEDTDLTMIASSGASDQRIA
jgi:trehalose-6-phosphate synthase